VYTGSIPVVALLGLRRSRARQGTGHATPYGAVTAQEPHASWTVVPDGMKPISIPIPALRKRGTFSLKA
jgi:hypothetical protein